MKEKIAIIDPLGSHGSSHHFYIFGQVKGLIENDLDVSIYTNNITKNPHFEGVLFYQFYKNIFSINSSIISGFRYLFGSFFSIFHAKFSGVRICHYHLFHVNILVLFDFLLTKFLRMKVVYTIHDVVSFNEKRNFNFLNNFLYMFADKILTHNRFSKDILCNININIKTKIDIIPHGNYTSFINLYEDQNKSREKLSFPKDKKILLFFGMIKKVKGLDVLLKALKDVISVNKDIVLVIAGKVWNHDFSVYQSLIDEHNLSDHCIVHNNFISHHDLDFYYSSADLVVLPYKKIYQSGVLMMSLSYEKPVLVSDLSPLTEIIIDNETGFVFKSGDSVSLSNKLISIFSDLDNLESVRIKGSDLVKIKFDWMTIGTLTKESYFSIL